jgi:hypothetical protein
MVTSVATVRASPGKQQIKRRRYGKLREFKLPAVP